MSFLQFQTPKTNRLTKAFRSQMECYESAFETRNVSQWPRHAQRHIAGMETEIAGSLRRETRGQWS